MCRGDVFTSGYVSPKICEAAPSNSEASFQAARTYEVTAESYREMNRFVRERHESTGFLLV